MVDKFVKGSDPLSPMQSKKFAAQRNSVQPPVRKILNSPSKHNFRVVESGELRVVNKAAKMQWNFAEDNSMQLKRHLHDLRFPERNAKGDSSGMKDTNTVLVRVGLTNLNLPSTDNLATFANGYGTSNSIFDHTIRTNAPNNYLEPIESKVG